MEDELVLICGRTHPLYSADCITIDRLPEYDFILREKGSGTRELFDSTLLVYGIAVKPAWESVSTQAIINAVSEGLGLSVLSYRMIRADLDAGHVKPVKIEGVRFKRPFSIIYHKNKFLTDSAKEFMALCGMEE